MPADVDSVTRFSGRSDKCGRIWSDISPCIRQVLGRAATWDEGLLLFLERSGFAEETYHTFSYSPVYDDGGRIAGMLCVVTEVTESVLAERRQHTLRDLGARASFLERASTAREACRVAVETLAQNPSDLPFVAALLLERGKQSALPVAAVGVELANRASTARGCPQVGSRWRRGGCSRQPVVVGDLANLQMLPAAGRNPSSGRCSRPSRHPVMTTWPRFSCSG
jgi:hypothetical protein